MGEVPARYKEGMPERYVSFPTLSTIFIPLKHVMRLGSLQFHRVENVG